MISSHYCESYVFGGAFACETFYCFTNRIAPASFQYNLYLHGLHGVRGSIAMVDRTSSAGPMRT